MTAPLSKEERAKLVQKLRDARRKEVPAEVSNDKSEGADFDTVEESQKWSPYLHQIATENAGNINPDLILVKAKDPKHPLHAAFCWDDALLGDRARRVRAYKLIIGWRRLKEVQAIRQRPDRVTNITVNLRRTLPVLNRKNEHVLREQALADAPNRGRLVDEFVKELRRWCYRTIDFDELAGVRQAITEALDSL